MRMMSTKIEKMMRLAAIAKVMRKAEKMKSIQKRAIMRMLKIQPTKQRKISQKAHPMRARPLVTNRILLRGLTNTIRYL